MTIMQIASHMLKDVPYRKAHSFGGEMAPSIIIVHDTAGRLDRHSSVSWFESADCNTSAHIVIERDGSMTQQVPFNRKAWHAGPSTYKGKTGCNSFAIGIEIVNPGKLDKDGRAWFHKKTEKGFDGAKRTKTKEHGDGYWMDYTPAQIEAVTALCKALAETYPAIDDITTHWAVSPGRKVDTNPMFPLADVKTAVFASDGAPLSAAALPSPREMVAVSRKFWLIERVKVWLFGGGIATLIGGKSANDASVSDPMGLTQAIFTFVKEHGVYVAIATLIIGYIIFEVIQHFMRQDKAEGRYTPSKEAA